MHFKEACISFCGKKTQVRRMHAGLQCVTGGNVHMVRQCVALQTANALVVQVGHTTGKAKHSACIKAATQDAATNMSSKQARPQVMAQDNNANTGIRHMHAGCLQTTQHRYNRWTPSTATECTQQGQAQQDRTTVQIQAVDTCMLVVCRLCNISTAWY